MQGVRNSAGAKWRINEKGQFNDVCAKLSHRSLFVILHIISSKVSK